MKRSIFAVLITCCIAAVSCKKESQTNVQNLYIGANMGGATWVAKPATSTTKGDSLQVQGNNGSGNSTLVFKMAFNGVGNYTLGAGDATFTSANGATTVYQLDPTQSNTVTIAQYNVGLNLVNGSFQLHFIEAPGSAAPGTTLSLTNGQFSFLLP